uniref:cyclin-dependent kinase n=1 Tax=Dunaliella tertiolecta TaxID=3047 RepID=A0A7S3QM04_DUNTE|mmetsp:Transcript_18940/g.53069  ORF Transcript_18940/g.53069 Transcript_18940/m.53069 type:complete len:398 (-) Transcript_18940:140-1333(-)
MSEDLSPLPILDSVTEYEKICRIGEGTYGIVYKARHRGTGDVVALKKVGFNRARDGIPVTSMRELRVLQETCHPNIVRLLKVVTGSKPDSVFLVFEFCQHDMGRLLDTMPRPFTHQEVKSLMKQLLAAVDHCHQRWVMHRDIKMSNLLYTNTGHLKLCDLGLARYFQPFPAVMTPRVVTLWYRAPEVLLGAEVYDEAVDMWSVGCVFGELLRHAPLFPAKTELECLKLHCELLGTPTPSIWKGIEELPHYKTLRLPEQPYNYVKQKLGKAAGGSQAALDLLNRMLMYDPSKRITAAQALRHPFFTERPYPLLPPDMPTFPNNNQGHHQDPHMHTSQPSLPQRHQHHDGRQHPYHSQFHIQSHKRPYPGSQQGLRNQHDAKRLRQADQDRRFGDAFGG